MSSPPKYTSPPAYGSTAPHESDTAPLLPGKKSAAGIGNDDFAAAALGAQVGSSRMAWMDQPAEDDVPEDFKVGVCVADCDESIRRAFIRKVYAILLAQLALTAVVAGSLSLPGPKAFVQENSWIVITSLVMSFVSLFGVYWKRHNYPANMFILAAFTFFESIMIGSATSYYDSRIVLQALLITTAVFVGLTLFTFQTTLDFSSFGPFLFAGLWGLIGAGLVGFFIPFSHTFDMVYAGIGVLIFSGFVLYDTQQIMKRLSVDEAIIAAMSLYLDFLNLFLYILRLLNSNNDN